MDPLLITRLAGTLRQLRRHDRWTRQQLLAYQAGALERLRAHADARSPFYTTFHAGLRHAPLHELPVLTKAIMMEHFDELVTDRAVRLADLRAHVAAGTGERFRNRYWVCATSGSSGQPALMLFSLAEWATFLASFARVRAWAGMSMSPLHPVRLAGVASDLPWHMSTQGTRSLNTLGRWMPTLRFAANEPVAQLVPRLEAFQPQVLGGYPSMLRALADEQLAGRLHLAPRFVLSGSEVLTAETRRRIEAAWGPRLFEGYGTTEGGGGNAAECDRHEGMHLFEDLVIPEVVDERNRPVPPGESGAKLLLTVLSSRTMPLIRYQIDDSLRLTGTTGACGRPFALIDSVQGRADDLLRFPSAAGGTVTIHPIAFTRLLDTLDVTGWQVIQEPDGLRVLLAGHVDPSGDAALTNALAAALAAHGARRQRLHVEHVAAIPRTTAGKAPLIKAHRPAATARPPRGKG